MDRPPISYSKYLAQLRAEQEATPEPEPLSPAERERIRASMRPKIGLFWFVPDRLGDPVLLDQAWDVADPGNIVWNEYLNPPSDHARYWHIAREDALPGDRDRDWKYWPRGRVVALLERGQAHSFQVWCDRQIAERSFLRAQIVGAYRLPSNTAFRLDPGHYDAPGKI
jgi:hypothetical protein